MKQYIVYCFTFTNKLKFVFVEAETLEEAKDIAIAKGGVKYACAYSQAKYLLEGKKDKIKNKIKKSKSVL